MASVTERLGEIAGKYATNATNAAPVWAARASAEADKWDRNAKSTQAEQNYAIGVQEAIKNNLRLKGLQRVSAADFAAAVSGAQDVYAYKVSGAGAKWQNRFSPYAAVLDRVVPTLQPKKPGDVKSNVINRVLPIAEAMRQQKVGGAVARGYGIPTPTAVGRSPFTR